MAGEQRIPRDKSVPLAVFPPQVLLDKMGSNSKVLGEMSATNGLKFGTVCLVY